MLHLYFVAFCVVVVANIVAVLAIAATIKRDRYRPIWLWPNVPKAKSHLSRWLAPLWGYWRSLGCTSLFCVRGISHDTEPTRNSCRRG